MDINLHLEPAKFNELVHNGLDIVLPGATNPLIPPQERTGAWNTQAAITNVIRDIVQVAKTTKPRSKKDLSLVIINQIETHPDLSLYFPLKDLQPHITDNAWLSQLLFNDVIVSNLLGLEKMYAGLPKRLAQFCVKFANYERIAIQHSADWLIAALWLASSNVKYSLKLGILLNYPPFNDCIEWEQRPIGDVFVFKSEQHMELVKLLKPDPGDEFWSKLVRGHKTDDKQGLSFQFAEIQREDGCIGLRNKFTKLVPARSTPLLQLDLPQPAKRQKVDGLSPELFSDASSAGNEELAQVQSLVGRILEGFTDRSPEQRQRIVFIMEQAYSSIKQVL